MIQFTATEIREKAKAMRMADRLTRVPDHIHPGDAYSWARDDDCYWELWVDRAREALIAERLAAVTA